MSQSKTKNKEDKSWIFLLLLLVGVLFIFLSQTYDSPKSSISVSSSPEHLKQVDSHLKDTAFNVEADRRQRQIEAYQQLSKLRNTSTEIEYKESKDFSLESDPNMQALTQELNRSKQSPPDQATPEEIVQQKLYDNYQFQQASEAYRSQYAQQFIENARKGGWEIELGPNYEVLSVKKLSEKRFPSLFNDSGSSGGR